MNRNNITPIFVRGLCCSLFQISAQQPRVSVCGHAPEIVDEVQESSLVGLIWKIAMT
jgi:hypothetical protein